MGRFSGFLTHGAMLFRGNNRWIWLPIIGENYGLFISRWNAIPECLTGFFAAITAGVSHHFSGLPAQRNPKPNFGVATEDKGPDFVSFQYRGAGINGFQRGFKGWKLFGLFFNHALKVCRQTPNVRSIKSHFQMCALG